MTEIECSVVYISFIQIEITTVFYFGAAYVEASHDEDIVETCWLVDAA